VKRIGGPGDLGTGCDRLCSTHGCQGEWDNYQCKHYEKPLGASRACEDAGKIIFMRFGASLRRLDATVRSPRRARIPRCVICC